MVTMHEWTKSTFEAGKELEVDKLFRQAIKHNASDLHLQVGRPAVLRIRGSLHDLQMPAISESQMVELVFPMMDQRNLDIFHRDGGAELAKDVTYEGEEWSVRVTILTQM